jgi:hypothetical protein|tara:strand:- start:29 stop:445 length:417 start_codon:yes stop_codon:yes gene_type:complete
MGINGLQNSSIDYLLIDQTEQITETIDDLKTALLEAKKTSEITAIARSLYTQLNLVAPAWIYYHYGYRVLEIIAEVVALIELSKLDSTKFKHKKLKAEQLKLIELFLKVEPNCKTHERRKGHDGRHKLSRNRFEFFNI